jgi:hypothetical protein
MHLPLGRFFMKSVLTVVGSVLTSFLLRGVDTSKPVLAQPIPATTDGTGTLVTPNENRFDIHGGRIFHKKFFLISSTAWRTGIKGEVENLQLQFTRSERSRQ